MPLSFPARLRFSQELEGGQSWPQPPFRRPEPAESRLRAELPALQSMQHLNIRNTKWHWASARAGLEPRGGVWPFSWRELYLAGADFSPRFVDFSRQNDEVNFAELSGARGLSVSDRMRFALCAQ